MAVPPFTGAVLTGGRSTRMGTDKALLEVAGEPMAARVARALRTAGAAEVLAIGGNEDRLRALPFDRVLPDLHPGEGPLGGLLTAFADAGHPIVAVLACDLPAASPELIAAVVAALDARDDADVAMPVTDRREPLHAAWRIATCEPVLTRRFAAGERAMHRAVDGLVVVEVVVTDPAPLRNVNRPADLPR